MRTHYLTGTWAIKTMRIEELRLLNLTYLIDTDFGGNKAAFAVNIDKNPSYVSRWYSKSDKHKRNISGDTAREIEKACGYPDGWLDANHDLVRDNDAPEYLLSGTDLAESVNDALMRQENRLRPRRVPVFNDQDILDRKAARDLIDDPGRETVNTDIDVTDNAFIWRVPTTELGDLNLPFSAPVTAALIIEPGIQPKSGDWVIVTDADNNIMVKRFEQDMPHAYMHSLKAKHEPFKMDENYIINGVVTSINLKTR